MIGLLLTACSSETKIDENIEGKSRRDIEGNSIDGCEDNGTDLIQIIFSNRSLTFTEGGTRITKIFDLQGNARSTFNYANNKLVSAHVITFNKDINFSFEYQNDKLSRISKTINGNTIVTDLEYSGNHIIVHDPNEPPGLYKMRLTFDTDNRIVSIEEMVFLSNKWVRNLDSFRFAATGLYSVVRSFDAYNPATGTFYDIGVSGNSSNFSFHEDVRSPIQSAMEPFRIAAYFEPDLMYNLSLSDHARYALFEMNYLSLFRFATSGTSYRYTQEVDCTNEQKHPLLGRILSKYGDLFSDTTFIYE